MPDFPQTLTKGKHQVKVYAPTPSKSRYRISYWIDGTRHQRNFVTYEDAKKQAERILTQLSKKNPAGAALKAEEARRYLHFKAAAERRGFTVSEAFHDWTTAVDLLPENRSLLEAARQFSTLSLTVKPIRISEAVKQYLKEKEKTLRPRTFEQETQRLTRFSEAFVSTTTDLDREPLRIWINSLKVKRTGRKVAPKTRNLFRESIKGLLAWCVDHDHIPHNHRLGGALKPERIRNEDPITIYTPEEFARLLQVGTGTLQTLVAIAGLCGLRSSELLALEWKDILPSHIQVAKHKAKTRQRRLVPIGKRLRSILKGNPSGKGTDHIWESTKSTYYRDLEDLHARAGVERKDNAFRHSFCSYRLARTSDENLTAREAGTSPEMIYRHYGEVVTKKEAIKWFK